MARGRLSWACACPGPGVAPRASLGRFPPPSSPFYRRPVPSAQPRLQAQSPWVQGPTAFLALLAPAAQGSAAGGGPAPSPRFGA